MNSLYHYFVEGECEQKLIVEGKKPPWFLFKPGKVEVFNVVSKELSLARLLSLNKHTSIILVYDIDNGNLEILQKNIKLLNKFGFKKIYHIQSVNNFEDEIVFSTDIENINDMFNTKGVINFKQKFINHKSIISKLNTINFDVNKMWSRISKSKFGEYVKESDLLFIKKV